MPPVVTPTSLGHTVKRQWWRLAGVSLIVAIAAGAGGWALSEVLRPASTPLAELPYTTVTIRDGELGHSMQLNAAATWETSPQGINRASGIVTAVAIEPGGNIQAGSMLYAVDQRPVIAGEGATPAFRNLHMADTGDDVAQLQRLLTGLGHFTGRADGTFGASTELAVKAWQRAQRMEPTGVVELGDIIYLDSLPTAAVLASDMVSRGKSLIGGEEVLDIVPASPTIRVHVTEIQESTITVGTEVNISSPGGTVWRALAGQRTRDEESNTTSITLTSADDQPLCADTCAEIPVEGETLLAVELVTTPTVQGLIVPAAAIATGADGVTFVVDSEGTRLPITIVTSARSLAVITGEEIASGLSVRVPGQL